MYTWIHIWIICACGINAKRWVMARGRVSWEFRQPGPHATPALLLTANEGTPKVFTGDRWALRASALYFWGRSKLSSVSFGNKRRWAPGFKTAFFSSLWTAMWWQLRWRVSLTSGLMCSSTSRLLSRRKAVLWTSLLLERSPEGRWGWWRVKKTQAWSSDIFCWANPKWANSLVKLSSVISWVPALPYSRLASRDISRTICAFSSRLWKHRKS